MKTYSQFGEDIITDTILRRSPLFSATNNGTYIDIGACWPVKLSNTFTFYQRGWSGLCIDPRPEFEVEFEAERPRDICVNCGVSDTPGDMNYFMFENPVFNSFDAARARSLDHQGQAGARGRRIVGEKKIRLETLQFLVDTYLEGRRIDFVSLDVEGFELPVLKSLDFTKQKPTIWIVEFKAKTVEEGLASDVCSLLREVGYSVSAATPQNLFLEVRQ